MSDQALWGGRMFFRSNEEAFDHACKYTCCDLVIGRPLLALVLDATELYATQVPVDRDAIGIQTAVLMVSSYDGGFKVPARTSGKYGPALEPGDLVYWQPTVFSTELAGAVEGHPRFGWVGLITGTIRPEWMDGEGYAEKQPFSSGNRPQSDPKGNGLPAISNNWIPNVTIRVMVNFLLWLAASLVLSVLGHLLVRAFFRSMR